MLALPMFIHDPLTQHILFFFNDPATTEIYTLSLHDALPIFAAPPAPGWTATSRARPSQPAATRRSEEHTSELQSRENLVCRLLLEKKNTDWKIRMRAAAPFVTYEPRQPAHAASPAPISYPYN